MRAAGQLHVVIAGGAYTSLPLSIPNNTRITVSDPARPGRVHCCVRAACQAWSCCECTKHSGWKTATIDSADMECSEFSEM